MFLGNVKADKSFMSQMESLQVHLDSFFDYAEFAPPSYLVEFLKSKGLKPNLDYCLAEKRISGVTQHIDDIGASLKHTVVWFPRVYGGIYFNHYTPTDKRKFKSLIQGRADSPYAFNAVVQSGDVFLFDNSRDHSICPLEHRIKTGTYYFYVLNV